MNDRLASVSLEGGDGDVALRLSIGRPLLALLTQRVDERAQIQSSLVEILVVQNIPVENKRKTKNGSMNCSKGLSYF